MSQSLWAAGGGDHMLHADVDLSDQESLQRGARTFVNYCLSCHSASYMRFNRMGEDLGIGEEILESNFMFGAEKTGATMDIALQPEDGEQFFGVAPPDLSVIARARGADWLYTYFMTFYRDPDRPLGVNNLAFKDVSMPHVLWELQGWQRPVYAEKTGSGGETVRHIDHLELESPPQKPAAYEGQDYEQVVNDLVNFLVYLGEPIKLQRYSIGVWVMLYLVILLIIVYLLKKAYWRDIH
jgi:ubiquinol-cytochrome c reductase cytochrome c1 subunit